MQKFKVMRVFIKSLKKKLSVSYGFLPPRNETQGVMNECLGVTGYGKP